MGAQGNYVGTIYRQTPSHLFREGYHAGPFQRHQGFPGPLTDASFRISSPLAVALHKEDHSSITLSEQLL